MPETKKKFSARDQRIEEFKQSIKTLSNAVSILKKIGREEDEISKNRGNSKYLKELNDEWSEYLDYARGVDKLKLKGFYLNTDIRSMNHDELIAYFIMMNSNCDSHISRSEYAYDLSSEHHLIISHSDTLDNLVSWVKHQGVMEKAFL